MYKLTNNALIVRLLDNAHIPPDPANTDFQEYLKWVDEGNEPLEADPLPDNSDALRAAAYVSESDPLFFKAQRGEATMDQWLAKVQEIKNRYPPLA